MEIQLLWTFYIPKAARQEDNPVSSISTYEGIAGEVKNASSTRSIVHALKDDLAFGCWVHKHGHKRRQAQKLSCQKNALPPD